MKLYRLTVSDFGSYGPRGLTHAGTGLTTWAFTDKAQAVKRYKSELKTAKKENRAARLRLQIISTPQNMTTELWIRAIVMGEVPYEILETLCSERTTPVKLVA